MIKSKLTEDLALDQFDPSLPITLLTDASRLHGVDFILVQTPKISVKRVIQCGSRSLTPADTNYATIELETLDISWVILQCDFFLTGMQHFEVYTDHRPPCHPSLRHSLSATLQSKEPAPKLTNW